MKARDNKNRWYSKQWKDSSAIIFGEDFSTLKVFKDYCQENNYQQIFNTARPAKNWKGELA